MKTIKDNQKGKQKMIVKAFNQEFNININVAVSQINLKIVRLIESKRVDLLRELNDFIAADRAEYDKVKSAARAEYDKVDSAAWAEYDNVKSAARAEYDKVDSAARAEYDKVDSAAMAEYDEKINKKLDELLARIEK